MLFWDYIKCLNGDGNYYTYINFPNRSTDSNEEYKEYKATPFLKSGLSTTSLINFGHLLTSADYITLTPENSDLEGNLRFYLKGTVEKPVNSFQFVYKTNEGVYIPWKIDNFKRNIKTIDGVETIIYNSDTTLDTNLILNKTLNVNGNTIIDANVTIGNPNETNNTTKGNLSITNKCQAKYFNVTSDMRAKTNLRTLDLNACDYIKRIPIYSFRYKNNLKPSIGVLAQDLTNKPIDEYANNFNFVDNMQATGINNDYMSIKESKFVYLCMKAIQELTDENRMLMCKINDLENQIAQLNYRMQ